MVDLDMTPDEIAKFAGVKLHPWQRDFITFFNAKPIIGGRRQGRTYAARLFDIYQTLTNVEIHLRLNIRVEPIMSLDQYTSREASERRMRRLGETLAQRRLTFDELAAMPIALRTLVVAYMMPDTDDAWTLDFRRKAIAGAALRK